MDLLFRLGKNVDAFGELDIHGAREYFYETLPKERHNFFFDFRKRNPEKFYKGSTVYYSFDGYIVAKAVYTGKYKQDLKNIQYPHGYKMTNIEIIYSNERLSTDILSRRITYLDTLEKQIEVQRVLSQNITYPEDENRVPEDGYPEGSMIQTQVNAYERNKAARDACIRHYGCKCFICKFDFTQKYGELGDGFIHVHHIIPLNKIKKNYSVKPTQDLVPLCPNCHAMVHRTKASDPIEDIKQYWV
ncbi:MAG: endonuclease [Proteobacteria bacterium]|nr:endonuclease [Pseudomonadota bacterium]